MTDTPAAPAALPTPEQTQANLASFDAWAQSQRAGAPAPEDHTGNAAATAEAEAARAAAQARATAIANGDKTALAQLEAETAAAPKPGEEKPGDTPAETPDAMPAQPYDFGSNFTADTPAAKILEANKITHALVTGLGFEQDAAKGAVQMIAEAQAARGAKPMDTLEHNRLDFLLRERFGADFDARMDVVQAKLNKLGPVRGGQLQFVLNSIGPDAAAWAFETLSRRQA